MNVEIHPKAAKYLERMNNPDKGRIIKALKKLSEDPPSGDIKSLVGESGYRLRVGSYRVLFDVTNSAIIVYDIGPRGQIYKGGK